MGFNEELDVAAVEKYMSNFDEKKVNGKHYDALIDCVCLSLSEFNMPQSVVTEAVSALEPLRIAFVEGVQSFSSIHSVNSSELPRMDSKKSHFTDCGTPSLSKRFYDSFRKHTLQNSSAA